MSQRGGAHPISLMTIPSFLLLPFLFAVIGKHREGKGEWKDESGDGSLMNSDVDVHAIYKPQTGET